MQEPLVSAMGRVLGYPHPPLTASDMADGVFTVVFEAVVTGVRGGSQAKEYLASVGCRSMEDAAAVRVVLERDWLVPSIRAMAGATVVGPGRHMYVVQGFELNLVSLRM